MPIMPGKYPPSKNENEPEVLFDDGEIEVISENRSLLTSSQDEDLVVLEPSSITVQRDKALSDTRKDNDLPNPYNVEHYLLTSSEGFSPFEQNLGTAPFHDLHGESIWAALAYTEDGAVHPAKVFSSHTGH